MDKQQSLLLKKYLDLLIRWKFLFITLLLISLPAGLMVYLIVPKVYEADSLLSYQQQKINPNKMSPHVQAKIQDIVSSLAQIVTSRTNLEIMIKSFDLYQDKVKQLPMEDVIDLMRENIRIEPSKRGDNFTISYQGSNPNKVAKVANALAAKFIEENMKYREQRATETSNYVSDELRLAKATMDRKEAAMRDFKLKNFEEMPEQREGNMKRLTSLQEQYQGKLDAILELERTRVMVQEQLAAHKNLLESQTTLVKSEESDTHGRRKGPVLSIPEQLQGLQAYLATLLTRYTENHPEVKRTRKMIAKLEKDESAIKKKKSSPSVDLADQDTLDYQAQLKKIDLSVNDIQKEKEKLGKTIKQYEKWIEATPVVEAEWTSLTREYGELKKHYDALVAQNLQAQSMVNLERMQKGSQFRIEDPARLPEKPVKPNFYKVVGGSVFGALACGAGFLLLISFLDKSYRDPDEVEADLGLPVVCTVTYLYTGGEKRKNKYRTAGLTLLTAVSSLMVVFFFWYAWSLGKIIV